MAQLPLITFWPFPDDEVRQFQEWALREDFHALLTDLARAHGPTEAYPWQSASFLQWTPDKPAFPICGPGLADCGEIVLRDRLFHAVRGGREAGEARVLAELDDDLQYLLLSLFVLRAFANRLQGGASQLIIGRRAVIEPLRAKCETLDELLEEVVGVLMKRSPG
jgi:hypothetical protein